MNNHQPIFDKVKGLPVIIVVNYPFTQRDYERYGVETFKKYGMDIQVWDITNIYNKDVSFEESRVDNDVVISIQKISELKKKIQFLTDKVWIYIVFPIGVKKQLRYTIYFQNRNAVCFQLVIILFHHIKERKRL